MAIIEPTVDHIDDETLMRELRNLAGAVDKNETALNNELEQLSGRQDQVDESIAGFQSQIDANKSAIENEVVARQNADDSEAEARQQADITGASLSIVSGAIQLMLNRALGAINANVTAPFIKTMELIPTATERAFKLRITYWDNTQYDTNDFVIPAGGGTDVSVTGVTIQDGTTPNSFQVQIELSDGTPIDSNDYPFPTQTVSPYPTSATLALSGNTLNLTIGLSNSTSVSGSIDLAPILANYVTDTELTQVQSDLQEQISGLKLSTDGNNITLNGDSVAIVKTVSGQVTNGNLKITINGVQSGDIPLPESGLTVLMKQNTLSTTIQIGSSGSIETMYCRVYDVDNQSLSNEFPIFDENDHMIGKGQQKYGVGRVVYYFSELTKSVETSEVVTAINSMYNISLDDGEYICEIIVGPNNPGEAGYIQGRITILNNKVTNLTTSTSIRLPNSFGTGSRTVVITFCSLKKSS